jgi:YHS domain-containing protein
MTFNWCHGPSCHKSHTQDRVRGVKGSKVLRTRKVKPNSWTEGKWWSYFCSNSCYNDFANTYLQQIIAIAPRTEALETPILDPTKERHENSYYSYNDWKIEVDNTRTNDIG